MTTVSFASIELDFRHNTLSNGVVRLKRPLGIRPRWKLDISEPMGFTCSERISSTMPRRDPVPLVRAVRSGLLAFCLARSSHRHCRCEHDVSSQHNQHSRELCPELVPCRVHQRSPPLYSWVHLSGQLHLVQEPDRCTRLPFADVRVFNPAEQQQSCREKGPGCDIRHRFALSAVYEIPQVEGSPAVRALTRNWQLSAVYQAQTGFPFTISVFGDTANSGTVLGENPIRANTTGQPIFGPSTHTASQWFNPAAFATPAAFTFGNVGRNTIYGPGLQTLDMAVVREFTLSERFRFQFRAEFFNALNNVNLGTPNRFVNTPQFGTITEATTPGRQIQFSARFSF